ncbi:hypothetical protein PR202_ga09228 [Eleusine coracana subsp. coracana]|uniref:Probable zinc-ribbon domain-containing protein n=1 Tax=Eleusine coracana subsp. coracana TaxID=191504 RepID=A0AAV5C3P8_ELECO|nr:hypothetical protein PR202_ga09228 [Eleusine coracana subsp. coracana]
MQRSESEVKGRFGRCPYCRAMIYQDPNAVIFYCSKCRTPIRGTERMTPAPGGTRVPAAHDAVLSPAKLQLLARWDELTSSCSALVQGRTRSQPTRPSTPSPSSRSSPLTRPPSSPTNPNRRFLSRRSRVAEDDERPSVPSWSTPYINLNQREGSTSGQGSLPYRPQLGSVRTGTRSNGDDQTRGEERGTGSPLRGRVAELRPSSRRTRRSMSGDADSAGGSGTDSESDAAALRRRRASPLCSQDLDAASMDMSGLDPGYISRSALSDPAFQKDLIHALENLRRLIAAVDQPRGGSDAAVTSRFSAPSNDGSSSARTVTRRSSRLMRRLESQLVQALPVPEPRLPRNASTSSSASSSASSASSGSRHRARRAHHHCRPVLGGTPFVVCGECSDILQLPAAGAGNGQGLQG